MRIKSFAVKPEETLIPIVSTCAVSIAMSCCAMLIEYDKHAIQRIICDLILTNNSKIGKILQGNH